MKAGVRSGRDGPTRNPVKGIRGMTCIIKGDRLIQPSASTVYSSRLVHSLGSFLSTSFLFLLQSHRVTMYNGYRTFSFILPWHS